MNSKAYLKDGKQYIFNFEAMVIMLEGFRKKNKCTLKAIYEEFGAELNVSSSTVENWRKMKNSPIDLEMVEKIASILNTNIDNLLVEKKEENMVKYTQDQINAVWRIYAKLIDYLGYYIDTEGFDPGYFAFDCNMFEESYFEDVENKVYEKAIQLSRELKKEYIYLHGTEVYEALYEYINSYLIQMNDDNTNEYLDVQDGIIEGDRQYEKRYIDAVNQLDKIILDIA